MIKARINRSTYLNCLRINRFTTRISSDNCVFQELEIIAQTAVFLHMPSIDNAGDDTAQTDIGGCNHFFLHDDSFSLSFRKRESK